MSKRNSFDEQGFFRVVQVKRDDGADFWNVVDVRSDQIRSSWLSRAAALVAMADLVKKEGST